MFGKVLQVTLLSTAILASCSSLYGQSATGVATQPAVTGNQSANQSTTPPANQSAAPAANQNGTATITVTVTDTANLSLTATSTWPRWKSP